MIKITDIIYDLVLAKICGVPVDLSARNRVQMNLDDTKPDTLLFIAGAMRDPALAARSGMTPETGHKIFAAGAAFRKQFRKSLPPIPAANTALQKLPWQQVSEHIEKIAAAAAVPAQKLMLAILVQGKY